MTIITLYRYIKNNGDTVFSPRRPNKEHTEYVRLIADDGKILTKDGVTFYHIIDQESQEGWYEVESPQQKEGDMNDEH